MPYKLLKEKRYSKDYDDEMLFSNRSLVIKSWFVSSCSILVIFDSVVFGEVKITVKETFLSKFGAKGEFVDKLFGEFLNKF